MLTQKIKKIYIIHYNPLIDRKKYLVDYFSKNNITNFEFRNLYQRENLTEELKKNYFKLDNLNPSQICITIEHIETYKEIVNNCENNDDWYLILEDDAIFIDNFIEIINNHLNNLPDDAEYLDISDYFDTSTFLGFKSNNIWEKINYTRTCVSYLINKTTCEKLLNTIIPFEQAIDHELNRQILTHNIKTYWSNLSLVHHGHYGSSYVYYGSV